MQRESTQCAWWGSNLPNNVGARPHIAVEEGQARIGNEVGEAHVCRNEMCVLEGKNRRVVVEGGVKVFLQPGAGRRLLSDARPRASTCSTMIEGQPSPCSHNRSWPLMHLGP